MRPSQGLRKSQITVWAVPLAYAAAALVLGTVVPRTASVLLPGLESTISVNAAIGLYSAVASGMIALTGIVFSLTFLMVQFSATAYSPRLVIWVARDPVMSHAMGVFTATFLYALAALAWVDRSGTGRVPLVGVVAVTALLVISVIMFITLIQRVGLLQVSRMLTFTGDQARGVIEDLYPPFTMSDASRSNEALPSRPVQTLLHQGRPLIVQAIRIPFLTQIASRHDCLIKLEVSIGDAVFDSAPILRVFGAAALPEHDLRSAVQLGDERTFEQDPKYAIRLLVDIAIKALSPAINDPTTAVQALDQIEDLVIRLGRRQLNIGTFLDEHGKVRLVVGFPAWEDFLRLAFDEIRFYGATSVQVMRRMNALLSDLQVVLPEERRPALRQWHERLQTTIDRSFADQLEKLDASTEDLQGFGSTRRDTESPETANVGISPPSTRR
jgi:uncharacterized membrane protein